MARGDSGRIVIEVEPEMKRRLYAALGMTGSTLKDWFVGAATSFCEETIQPPLFAAPKPHDPTSNGSGSGGASSPKPTV